MEKIFIDQDINVLQGQEAEIKLSEKNDLKYVENDFIHKVDKERWQEAQNYERKTWMVLCSSSTDDRNYNHFEKFDNYSKLMENNSNIKKVIELGCGPFTNLRTFYYMLPNLEEVHLLDPLLNDYLNHNYCAYRNENFFGYKTVTHACPIEEFDVKDKYDLVIMNNVLEHCFDINIIFEKISEMLSTGGLFIFHDVYYTKDDVIEMVNSVYDSGHPIKLSKSYMENYLSGFEILFEKECPGETHKLFDKYFIGKKK